MFHIRGILVFRGEEKGDSAMTDVHEPRQELVTKMDAWNPIFFGDLEYVFGYALAGTQFQLYALYPDKSKQYPEGGCGVNIKSIGGLLNLERIADRCMLLQYMINIAKVFKVMEPKLPRGGPFLEQTNRTGSEMVLEIIRNWSFFQGM